MQKENNKNMLQDESETSLNFKEHKEFFETFFEMRKKYLKVNCELFQDLNNNSKFFEVITSLVSLIDWTNSQLSKKLDVTIVKNKIKEIIKISSVRERFEKLEVIFQEISKAHEETEILPKVNIEQEDYKVKFWKEEESMSLKELKKAWYDMFIINEK